MRWKGLLGQSIYLMYDHHTSSVATTALSQKPPHLVTSSHLLPLHLLSFSCQTYSLTAATSSHLLPSHLIRLSCDISLLTAARHSHDLPLDLLSFFWLTAPLKLLPSDLLKLLPSDLLTFSCHTLEVCTSKLKPPHLLTNFHPVSHTWSPALQLNVSISLLYSSHHFN